MGLNKSKNITAARRTLQKWMGRYVRLRDADPDTGLVPCITCDRKEPYGEGKMNAGHWIEADIDATRANEYNVNAQCIPCNQMANGMAARHGKAIARKYGEDIYNELLHLSEKDVTLTIEDTMKEARRYKKMYDELAKIKQIK